MNTPVVAALPDKALLWAPRLLALAVSLFLSIFALDAFSDPTSLVQGIPDFLIHLIPPAIVVAVVALAWYREWVGAVVFAALAAVYAVTARDHVSWIAAISGPLLSVGVLYFWVWTRRRKSERA